MSVQSVSSGHRAVLKLPPEAPKKSLFRISPTEMLFQNFVAHEVSEMVLSIMNKDKIPRMVKICMESSPYFQLACPSDVYHIVPPGASARVRIRFTPEETKDYSHELVCLTAKEKIVVPIRAICARAVLVFPDQLDFSTCPVNHSNKKTLLVRNVGNLEAHYQLSTQSPFSVVPATGTLGAGDTMEVTVGFHPLTNGEHSGFLAACCNTGSDPPCNQGPGQLRPSWGVLFEQQLPLMPRVLYLDNLMKKKKEEEGSWDNLSALPSNIAQNLIKMPEDPLLFSDDFFFIEPMEGEIGPNCSAEIKVTFRPLRAPEQNSFSQQALSPSRPLASRMGPFDMDASSGGRESRLPLHLRGEGQGPLVELSSDMLNLQNIFVDIYYVHEGHCAEHLMVCWFETHGALTPGFLPSSHGSQTFAIPLTKAFPPLSLPSRGCVTQPKLHFDLPELDFGDVSFGFSYTKSCRLINNSMAPVTFNLRMSDDGTQPAVSSFDQIRSDSFPFTQSCRLINKSVAPVTFKLRMSDDGTQPAVSSFDQIRSDSDPSWRNGIHFYMEPREFTMNPSQGTILPQGHQDIEVTLCSNTMTTFYRKMLVDLEGVAQLTNPTALLLNPEKERYPLGTEKPHCFVIEPREGVIPARSELPVTITATLDDTGLFDDSVQLFIGSSLWTTFFLKALSIGTTIVIDKPLTPEINLGYQFSLLPCIRRFRVTNRGCRFHRLSWRAECYSPPEEEKGQSVSALSSPKDDSQSPKRANPTFGVEPWSMELKPGQSADMVLRGFSHIAQEVQDYVFCEAMIGLDAKPKKIIETIVTCKFIHPSIEVSARQLSFRVEKKPSDVLRLQYQPLSLKNTCLLPLDLMLDLEQPFLVCDEDQQPLPNGQPVRLDVGETCHLYISFDPSFGLDLKSWKKEKVLKIDMVRGHPFVERITLQGEVHFPNLQIQPSTLEFGCIVPGTEKVRSLKMTNCSPLPVQYHWSFHSDSQVNTLRLEGIEVLHGLPTHSPRSGEDENLCSQPVCPLSHPPSNTLMHSLPLLPSLQGSIAPGKKQVLKFSYMPGLPGDFSRTYQLKVDDLDPENICLKGEASFPMISVNLPWNIKGNEKYEKTLKQLVRPLQQYSQSNKSVVSKKTQSLKTETLKSQNRKTQTTKSQTLETQNLKTQSLDPCVLDSGIVSNTQLQIKMMRMLVEKAALELEEKLTSHPPKSRFPDKELCQSLVKVELPQYVLDMGPVLKGYTETRTLKITNPGQIHVSFQVNVSVLQDTGFSVNLHQTNGLPPNHSMVFDVRFESAHRPQGDVEVVLPIEVTEGPIYNIRLRATVLERSLNLSKNRLQFSDILIGQSKVETIRLYNRFQVPCKWFITASKPVLKVKHRPLQAFSIVPLSGVLQPGESQQVSFTFSGHLNTISNVTVLCHVEGGPTYEVVVTGDASRVSYSLRPQEISCGSQILRMAVGSEYQKSFLMPPRAVGETLPPEVLEDYEAQKRPEAQQAKLKAVAEAKARAEAEAKAKAMGKAAAAYRTVTFCPESLVKMTGNPISRAVMRHLGIDPSSGRCEAQQHRGIVVIVHGPPQAGKTEIAAGLCQYYDAAYVCIDTVVEEAMANDQSPAGLCARELCTKAAMELKDKDEGDAELQWERAVHRIAERVLRVDEEEYNALPKEKKARVDKIIQEKKLIKTKPPEKETEAPENKETRPPENKETKTPEKKETQGPERKETQASERKETQAPERKETQAPEKKETKIPEKKETKAPERKETKPSEKKETKIPEKWKYKAPKMCKIIIPKKGEAKAPKEGAPKTPKKGEAKASKKGEAKAPKKGETKIPEDAAEMENNLILHWFSVFTVSTAPAPQQLNIISRRGKELNCLSCVLPEDLLVDILSERLKVCGVGEKETFLLRRDRRELKWLAQKLEEEAKALQEEGRQKEEEMQKKEKKGVSVGNQPPKPEKGKTKAPEKEEIKPPENKTKPPEKKETESPEGKEPKAPEKRGTKCSEKWETKAAEMEETEIAEDPAEMENNLILRFQIYESSQQNIAQVFSSWDRVQGTMQLPVSQKGNKSQPAAGNKGQKTNKPQEKVEKKPEQKSGDQRSLQSSQLETQSEVAEEAVRDEHVGVPCLDIQVSDPKAMIGEILREGKLPTEDEMLKHLGLHPDGPPLPPAGVLSIVEYPEERLSSAERVEPFTIVAPEGAAVEDNLAKAPHAKGSSAKGQPKTGKAASRDSSAKEKHSSAQRTESPWDSSATRSKSSLESASTPTEFLRLKRYRWIVPAHGQVELKVHFSTKKPGKFEQTLRFELMQSKRQYELPCRGTGLYPSICQNPRVVFPQWRETMEEDEIILKEYVESTKQFHFGPLLCGKSREWYVLPNCPNNSENITILNNSPTDVEVKFSFENDGETFLLDPPSMTLKPKEKQELTIWAYPTSPGFLEDKLICSIGKNPDPVVFSLCCYGVHVKLEVSPRQLYFDKLLLHRTDSRTLVLRNNGLLPMAWQLNGLDDLVEDFSLSQDNGIIDPHSEFEVTLYFKAEQIGSIAKTLRLEVSDTENILGIVQAENIKIFAEVYDVCLSIDMPEGPDGILEFGTINVLDNVKKVLSLKNKGRYNIEYSFTLKGAGPRTRDVASYFTVAPQSGILIASQPGVNVEILFHPTSEMLLKNKPILYCQVILCESLAFVKLFYVSDWSCSVKIKPQTLTFTISGKAHEPQLTVVCPCARSKRGTAVLRFKRLRVGRSEVLPLVIRNDGIIPLKFMLRLEHEYGAFFLKGRASTLKVFHTEDVEEDSVGNESKPTKPFFLLHCGQSTEFDVIFKPTLAQRLEGKIRLLVGDIYSNKILVELVGEGHKDKFTLLGLEEDFLERNAKSSLNKDIIDAVRVNHIQFGDCPVRKRCRRTFTMANRTRHQFMRFEWEADGPFQLSPKVGHLRPRRSKEITVTLKSDVPATFRRHLVKCKVTKIDFDLPPRKVPDWDDQKLIMSWWSTPSKDPGDKSPKIERVVKIAPEPVHTVVEDSSQEVEVYLSAVVGYPELKLNTVVVQFKDTLPFHTRTATFSMHNTGKVALEYYWEEPADKPAKKPYSITLMRRFLSYATVKNRRKLLHRYWRYLARLARRRPKVRPRERRPDKNELFMRWWCRLIGQQQQASEQQHEQPEQPKKPVRSKKRRRSEKKHLSLKHVTSSMEVLPDFTDDLALFSIDPYRGTLAPGQKQTFHVRFSPKCAGKFETTMLCRIPNLRPTQKKVRVILKGRAREKKKKKRSFGKPKRSVLRRRKESAPASWVPRPKKQVHWKPTST
ncbi:hydrocephalus-inducing protein homolog [Onychostruthus taczanowskii]|uniref:hydrocephalus-inducing protein homolog n=1 Tax=Onychostruthus taczanowskii TaxID=356909 RepID=UPI001B80C455|nr:hydrocephalus-inducing protein homolog [Onychostruthus taczanowskii]